MTAPIWHPSPNFGERRDGAGADMVVLHYTAMTSAEAALDRLCDPCFEVSAHYLIGQDGTLWQMVHEDHRAWHAGAGAWGDVTDVNSRSIGIELDNPGNAPFAEPLMQTLEQLLAEILHRHAIPPERVIAHSDMAPGRKHDPGPLFDWQRLAAKGLSIWPNAALASDTAFNASAHRFGYPETCPQSERLDAFRSRFRPGVSGSEDAKDRAIIEAVATCWPVARDDKTA